MDTMPLISCIVIGYNIEQYVEKCLDSIIAQDYSNYEIIFIDDGSKDHTLAIAQSKKEVQCFTKQNGGIISARSLGLEKAHGDYITFIDGDDYINENMLSMLASELDEDVDILFSDQWNEDKNGDFYVAKSHCKYGIYNGEKFIKHICTDNMLHFMFPKLYKRSFLIKAGYLSYPHITIGEDLLTNIFLGLNNPKVKYVNQVNYYYRFNVASVTRKENPGILQQVKTLEMIEEKVKKNNNWDKYCDYIGYLYYSYARYYLQFPFSNKFKIQIINECRKHLDLLGNNKLLKSQRNNGSLASIILYKAYYHFPALAFIPNGIIMTVRKIKN